MPEWFSGDVVANGVRIAFLSGSTGPRVLIEYDVQEPLAGQGSRVHGISRDPQNDYGMDWLGLHYQESSR